MHICVSACINWTIMYNVRQKTASFYFCNNLSNITILEELLVCIYANDLEQNSRPRREFWTSAKFPTQFGTK